MNTNYHGSGFHMKAPSVALEPVLGPVCEPPVQGLSFMSGREQYRLPLHGHGDTLGTGLQQHQFHMPSPFNGQQLNPEQPSHPCQDGVTSCLHGDRHVSFGSGNAGHQHMFESEFGPLPEAQPQECLSQQHQRRITAVPDYQHHGHPDGCHAVPAPCLPLDQSPNRAASFHGLPSSSPETNRLEHYRLFPQGRVGGSQYCFPCDPLSGHFDLARLSTPDPTEPKFSYCEAGSQMAGGNFHTFNRSGSRAPTIGGSKVDQQLPQQNAYCDRFGSRGKLEQGVSPRHHLMTQHRAGPISRQNPCSPGLPRLYHTPDFVPNSSDMQKGSVVFPNQHGQLDNHIHRLNGHNMRPLGGPVFDVPLPGPPPPQEQQFNSFSYLNMVKRPRFELVNGCAGENCSPVSGGLHHRPGLESHLSPSAFPAPMGDFTAHVTEGFPSGPPPMICNPHQQSLPRQPNAAMMIKQMACRNQQQRMRQADLQPLSHHGDVTPPNGLVHRGQQLNASQLTFDKRHHFHGNFDSQSPHLPPENLWFPDPHQQCREPHIHATEQSQNGHNATFRPGPTSMDMQCLNSPGTHNQFENSINNPLQVQPPDDGPMQPDTVVERRKSDFGGSSMGRQHSFPPGVLDQQGTLQSTQRGFSSSPGNYSSSHPEYNQNLSVNKLGALSLANLNKASPKDSVYGQSCLAALSTACQNMIASLGAPNLNVTFNKKSQNEAKRKPGQVEQDLNSSSSAGGGACGLGSEYFQSSASQNSHMPCSGNNNNATAGQSIPGQMVKREPSALSPDNSMDSGSEGKATTGSGRGRGKRRRDSGHVSPGNFSPLRSGNPVVSPGQQASSLMVIEGQGRTHETSLVSPSFGKPDLATSMDSGIQSVGKSDGVSPCMDFLDDASPNYCSEDPRINRTGSRCGSDTRGGYPDTPCMEQVRTPLGGSGQDEVHPLEILQAQIQLQRQQFSISEDQPLAGKPGKKPECQSGLNGDCALTGCSPEPGKTSMNAIDLDSLMTEQHAPWYGHSNKALDPGNSKCMGFWDRTRGQSDNKEGHG